MGEAAEELGITLPDDDIDDLAQDIIVIFLKFFTDLEDMFKVYPIRPPMLPWGANHPCHGSWPHRSSVDNRGNAQ